MKEQRENVRSVPRHISRRKNLRSKINKSMINTEKDFSYNKGVILAISRKSRK